MAKTNSPKVLFILMLLLAVNACTNKSQEEVNDENEEITANVPSVVGKEVTYSTDSITMKGYIAYDENLEGPRPGILVVHEWWGHNEYARKRADMLAELGYVALAVDMYGDGKQAEHPEDAGKFAMSVMTNIDAGKARFMKALEELKAHPDVDGKKIGAIGYCFGGSVVLTMANMGLDLDAVAAFHSGVQLPVMPEAGTVKAKVLVCNGADDPFIPAETVDAFKAAMDSAQVDYKYIAYEGVKHSFTNPAADSFGEKFDLPLIYNEEANQKSWEELKLLFDSVFD